MTHAIEGLVCRHDIKKHAGRRRGEEDGYTLMPARAKAKEEKDLKEERPGDRNERPGNVELEHHVRDLL